MSYGIDIADWHRQVGSNFAQILNSADPVEMPILLPTKVDFVASLRRAETFGFAIPPNVLAIADEVIA